jgi:hypothetical protein
VAKRPKITDEIDARLEYMRHANKTMAPKQAKKALSKGIKTINVLLGQKGKKKRKKLLKKIDKEERKKSKKKNKGKKRKTKK